MASTPRSRPIRTTEYLADVERRLPGDDRWRQRLKRREAAVLEDPEHHGYHLGGINRCRWAAPMGRYFIIYEIDKSSVPVRVRFVVFHEPSG